ncbi:site-specific integrase [Clostridium botulinum]|uniref:Integrase n=1 Tax=Clostridium botulinum TaxID=1491 RepID=A0A9Q1UX33_CLOBO|nr:site-specific integrase [Clostridium botulinum]AEB77547.1 integrase/recombinase, putative phage integrase [Clostridium botulinum BKT015925]KEH95945.1 integrase [Clostridium botulinum C/D str. Sp77]KEH96805.1 integrase [Clostridium botulinum D str. 16868]KLU74542.1 integrase [Clostridium botulinum V891]KOA73037.1 integrase [Clostridium botulinum]
MKTVEPIRDIKLIKAMRTYLKGESIRNELLFVFGINVGLRISDILKLRFSDLVYPDFKIKDSCLITEKKTGKSNRFYIGPIIKKVLETYIQIAKPESLDEYIFKSRKGVNKSISRQHAWYILNNAAEAIGLVKKDENGNILSGEIGTHSLRKTFGYHAYNKGVSLEILMQIFNHSSKRETLRYIGITEDEKKEVYLMSNLG